MDIKEQFVVSLFRFRKIIMTFPSGLTTPLKELDISLAEMVLIKGIADNKPESEGNITITDIQNSLFVSKAAVSQMLGSLERKGYLTREVDKTNRRKLVVTLTARGQEALCVMEDKMSLLLSKIVSRAGEENTEQLISQINRFAEVMEELRDEAFV